MQFTVLFFKVMNYLAHKTLNIAFRSQISSQSLLVGWLVITFSFVDKQMMDRKTLVRLRKSSIPVTLFQ